MTHTHRLYESGIREVLKGRHWALLKNVSYCFLNFIYLSLLLAVCDSSTGQTIDWTGLCLFCAWLLTGLGSVYLLVGRCFQHNIILRRPALVWSAAGLKSFLEGFVDLVDGGGGDHVWGQQWEVWLTSTPFRWKPCRTSYTQRPVFSIQKCCIVCCNWPFGQHLRPPGGQAKSRSVAFTLSSFSSRGQCWVE